MIKIGDMSDCKRIHVDPEKLIQEVKRRPMIYSKEDPNYYHNKKMKADCWIEICKKIVPDWVELTPQARVECCHEIQKRWKSLRTCFGREVSEQRKEQIRRQKNLSVKRRKIYGYYKEMKFLLPHFNVGARVKVDVEDQDQSMDQDSEDSDDPLESSIKTEINEFDRETRTEDVLVHPYTIFDNTEGKIEFSIPKKDEDDDVKQFLMSLVPTFNKFDDKQKFEAKIEILKVLKNISFTKEGTSKS